MHELAGHRSSADDDRSVGTHNQSTCAEVTIDRGTRRSSRRASLRASASLSVCGQHGHVRGEFGYNHLYRVRSGVRHTVGVGALLVLRSTASGTVG